MLKEADGSYTLVGRTPEIPNGESQRLTLNLEPGDYELQLMSSKRSTASGVGLRQGHAHLVPRAIVHGRDRLASHCVN